MMPYPKRSFGHAPPFGSAVSMSRCTTWYHGIDGYRDRTSAAAPDVNAAAKLVPISVGEVTVRPGRG